LVASAATVLVLGATPAHASGVWQNQDGFESSPASTWNFDGEGNGSGDFDIDAGTARTGGNDAWLTAQTGWKSVGRTIHLTPAQFHAAQCAATIYVQPSGANLVGFEVINPTSWTYIASEQANLNGGSYTAVDVGPWTPGPIDVYIRLVLVANNGGFAAARVDDLTVRCTY
jgi:hypothetical protein